MGCFCLWYDKVSKLVKIHNFVPDFRKTFSPSLLLSLVDLRGARHLLTSQHSLPGIPVALKQSIDLRTSMDGKYKEIAEVSLPGNWEMYL